MDPIINALAKILESLFTRPEHIALLVSLSANVAMGWFIITIRKENRLDWQESTEAIKSFTQTLDKIRLLLAAEFRNNDV